MSDVTKINGYDIKDSTARSGLNNKMDKENPTGTGSFSLNRKANTTIGDYSISIGDNNTASGNSSFSAGSGNESSEEVSISLGGGCTASAFCSFAEGLNTTASGYVSHAEGSQTVASGSYSHAEGNQTIATGTYQHVQGILNISDGTSLHIVGNGVNDTRSNAHTLASDGTAWFQGDVYTGSTSGTNKDSGSKKLESTGNKVTSISSSSTDTQYPTARATYTSLKNKMNRSDPSGTGTLSMNRYSDHIWGTNSVTLGSNNQAIGSSAIAEGYTTVAEGNFSHSEGSSTTATGNGAHAEGRYTLATSDYSHAEGFYTQAYGIGAHAEGSGCDNSAASINIFRNLATGEGSHVEGYRTEATGKGAHAEGWGYNSFYHVLASGIGSHAEGNTTVASGDYSHAEGCWTSSPGDHSHAEGSYTIARRRSQHVEGEYNKEDTGGSSTTAKGTYVHITGIGTGTSSSSRRNGFTLDWSGNAVFAGTVTPSGSDYCEFFEWEDQNSSNEDRAGYIVTINQNGKLIFANENDDVIGIVTSSPSIIGDSQEMEWYGKYERDEFSRIIYETIEKKHEEKISIETGEVLEEEWIETITRPKINENFNPDLEYIPRSNRPEWSPVGLIGKIITRDDGTSQVGKYITSHNGIATFSNEKTNMRVLERINDHLIKVLIK